MSQERIDGCVKIANGLATAVDLQDKLDACQLRSVAGFSFYNQCLLRYNALDWIKAALAALDDLTELKE